MMRLPRRWRKFVPLVGAAILLLSGAGSVFGEDARKMNEGETVADAAVAANSAMKEVPDVPGLPRVLLIGDSISIAYTEPVRAALQGKANVHRIPDNGQNTANGLKRLDLWLGSGKWDVIHFNFGLWDAKYRGESPPQVTRENYDKNLRELVRRLKATGARLIFASTTPVPAVLYPPNRHFDSIPDRNEIAVRVMKENGVAVDDLYAVILPRQAEFQRPKDVHFSPEGSELLAQAVVASILADLPPR